MTVPRLLATAVLTALVAVPVTVVPPAAALSCVGPSKVIVGAEQVYAGRIVDGGEGRILIKVTEIWKGGPVGEQVWLEVEMEGWTEWAVLGGEIPDGYSSPKTWVFAPHGAAVGPCSSWALDKDMKQYVLPYRPDQPQAPVAENARHDAGEATQPIEESESSVLPLVGGIGGAALLVALSMAVLLRRLSRGRGTSGRGPRSEPA